MGIIVVILYDGMHASKLITVVTFCDINHAIVP